MTATTAEPMGAVSAAQWRARGDAAHAAGDAKAGAEAHIRALAASTSDQTLMAAATALNRGNLPAAERFLKQQLMRAPTDIGAMRMLAELGARIGRYGDARALLDRALELAPQFDAARFARALVLSRISKLTEALEDSDVLMARHPDNLAYLNLRASILVKLGDFAGARDLYQRVLNARPDQYKIWSSLGHVLKTMGQTDEGIAAYRKAAELKPEYGEAWWSLANLKTFRFSDADIAAMEAGLSSKDADAEDVFHLHFALGKAFEDRRAFEASFRHYEKANAERRKLIDYDAADVTNRVASLKAALTPAFFAERRGYGAEAGDPIFIVGLPRAGSTLLEQILSSHPLIEGTMELPDLDKMARRLALRDDESDFPDVLADLSADACRKLGEEYLERTRIQRREGKPYFIDKLPNNWINVGLIQLALPNAKIIDARRHPVANCFSAWKQHFARGQSYTFAFGELARYYADYVALMAHFDAVLPGRVHRVIHERLVDDPEREIRSLLAYLGVAFDERCLAFHQNDRAVRTPSSEQVRRPISRDGVDQWRNYEDWLGPLVGALKPVMETWER